MSDQVPANIKDLFKGFKNASGSARLPKPGLGKAVYKLDTASSKDVEKGTIIELKLTCLYPLAGAKDVEGVDVPADPAGTQVSYPIFLWTRWGAQEWKDLSLVLCGITEATALEAADVLCPEADHPGKSELERVVLMIDIELPRQILAGESCAGALDGQIAVELSTVQKLTYPKLDKNKPVGEGNYVFDEHGTKLTKINNNTYFNRRVPLADTEEKLGEEGIARFFGSREKFDAAKEND